MKITNVSAAFVPAPKIGPYWQNWLGQLPVRIETDAGITGYGMGAGGSAGVAVVCSVLRSTIMGKDPANVEQLWRQMYEMTMAFGQKGLAIMAISGVDHALWDIRAKVADKPLAELLGGKVGQKIPIYAALLADHEGVQKAIDQGYRAVKPQLMYLNPQTERNEVVAWAKDARRRLGPDGKIMLDFGMRWGVEPTVKLDAEIYEHGIEWLEEPVWPDEWEEYEELVRRCRIPIAGGEHEFTAKAFERIIDHKLHHVVQPDPSWCGGMTTLVEIYRKAKAAGVKVRPHRGSEIWGLHAVAAFDDEPMAEMGRGWIDYEEGAPKTEHGYKTLSNRPGYGVEFPKSLNWVSEALSPPSSGG